MKLSMLALATISTLAFTAAHAEVEQEVNRAREELRGQVASIAVAGAERIIAKEIDATTHKNLLDKLAAEI